MEAILLILGNYLNPRWLLQIATFSTPPNNISRIQITFINSGRTSDNQLTLFRYGITRDYISTLFSYLPPANEVWGKVMFSQTSVILSTEGVCLWVRGLCTLPLDTHTSLDTLTCPGHTSPLDIHIPYSQQADGTHPYWNAFLFI